MASLKNDPQVQDLITKAHVKGSKAATTIATQAVKSAFEGYGNPVIEDKKVDRQVQLFLKGLRKRVLEAVKA